MITDLKVISTKVLLILLLWFMVHGSVYSQQEPLNTQYMHNMVSVNPAYTGSRQALNMLLMSRLQWTGVEGAPQTLDFAMHTPFSDYKMGLGLSMVADNYGPVDNLYFNISYAYHVNLSEDVVLSFGIKAGIYNYSEGIGALNVGDRDPAFLEASEEKLLSNAGAGLYLYSNRFYLGGSAPRFMQTYIDGEQPDAGSIGELTPHYYLMGGAVFDVGYGFDVKPSFINRLAEGAPISADFTIQVFYEDNYSAGITYRMNEAVGLLAGMQINQQLMVGYSYDFPLPDIRGYAGGSHEIVISYDFAGFTEGKVVSPRHF